MLRRKTIGYRLIAAIAFMAFLTVSVSLIAVVNWEAIDNQIEAIVDKNMPTLKASYQLERNTSGLQATLSLLSHNTDPIMHNDLKQNINIKLQQITNAITDTAGLKSYPSIKTEHEILREDIDAYANLVNQRNTHLYSLTQTENTIRWLHQDLVDELTPLRQEVEWQLTRMLPNAINSEAIAGVMTEFSLIQAITINENKLHQLVQEIIQQRQQRDLSNAFYFIGYKTNEVREMSQTLHHYPSTISYRQLLQEFIALVEPDGVLEKLLKQDVELHMKISQHEKRIQTRLKDQEERIQTMVEQADTSLQQLDNETRKSLIYSNAMMLGVVSLSIFLSIILSIHLVGRGIVKRLNLLSKDLDSVTKGNLNANIQVTGDDEIGLLGDNLRDFCRQMQEMQQSNALNLINNTQASIITCNLNGVVESVNPSALRLFSYDTAMADITVWDLFNENMQQRLKYLFSDGSPLVENGACNLTLKQSYQENIQYLRLDFRLFKQGNSDKVIITMTDITEQENAARWLENMVREKTQSLTNSNRQLRAEIEDRKRVEDDLRATQDDLIQAAKMAVVGQAMTSLAHELNQPLSAISTHVFATKIAIKKHNHDRLASSLDKIDNLTARMGNIISSLRSFSRKQSASNPLIRVNIHESINQAMLIIESRAKVQKTTIINEVDTALYALADQVQLEQVLVNLMVNSCDAVAASEQREITISTLDAISSPLRITVRDTGDGFADESIKKLFIPFTTTKDVGLGLGLSICRSIMTRLGGEIFLASNLQGGAMVVLELINYDNE
ncbi:ATP-binding protein [Photobacterium lipolyticum]|uniref:C4-dicarboxylate transport sensor protein DctB n=1 Tax=Photobacterium lipolyticum TaxID=266810 RepID=A0A2T3MVZ9_9GAMM|nr:ATP-binding protein [Photobacterium lipolyticum]PSW04066.1 histidine kinase [Photobacterium lipolyticum]